ncbi:hypothetical protein D3C71_566160 [compost metagenome]|jgi:hypothetical protein
MPLGTLTNEPLLVAGMRLGRRIVGWLGNAAYARVALTACVIALLELAQPSVALAYEGLPGAAAYAPELSVTLAGRIDDHCAISGGGAMALGELTPGESVAADFSLDCNVPFDIRIASANGGLTHLTKPDGEGPFAGRLPYDLQVRIPTLNPGASSLTGSFSSAELRGEAIMSSGQAVAAAGRSRLALTTRNVQGAGLLAGDYSEILTISVEPRM